MDGKMIRIAISGQAKTGKNTLAEMIVNNLDTDAKNCCIAAVADPIKNIAMLMVPNADSKCLWGESELRSELLPGNLKDAEGNPLSYRRFLLDLGKFGRLYNNDIWLDALVRMTNQQGSLKTFIISDVRFPNEIQYFKKNGFYMVRLKRSDIPQIDDISETAQLEVPDDYFDQVIVNDGTLQNLNEQAKLIINKLV